MSKGPGKWQRAILAELASQESFWLRSMLGPSCTKAEYNALLRAALKLEGAGLILIDRYAFGGTESVLDGMRFRCVRYIGRTAIRRVGTNKPARRLVSVSKVPFCNFTNT